LVYNQLMNKRDRMKLKEFNKRKRQQLVAQAWGPARRKLSREAEEARAAMEDGMTKLDWSRPREEGFREVGYPRQSRSYVEKPPIWAMELSGGKYPGEAVCDVAKHDMGWVEWCAKNGKGFVGNACREFLETAKKHNKRSA
jgi:hypothetical protein